MYTLNTDFNPDQFLATYWQKAPLVIRSGIIDFDAPLDEHDLAGMAMEADIDSRIVSRTGDKWDVAHGPFEDFDQVCKGKWSLLVQATDRYSDEVDELMSLFSFIPYWRMDDVMISFAVEGAGVGAHTDQYDVFLIQGKGSRRWRVAPPDNAEVCRPHKDLQQVASFNPDIDVVLEPGDILYIPPGWAHEGTALEDCLTYSIGFRAPDQNDLLQQLADHLAAAPAVAGVTPRRYSDPHLLPQEHPSMVSNEALSGLRQLMIDYLQSDQGEDALLSILSAQHLPENMPGEPYTLAEITEAVETGCAVYRAPGCKPVYSENQADEEFAFYVNGERFSAASSLKPLLLPVLAGQPYPPEHPVADADDIAMIQLLAILINKGYWELRN